MSGRESLFVDANIFMYLAGRDARLRERCRRALRAAAEQEVTLVTSVEVLQEILHRYAAIERPAHARAVYGAAIDICAEIFPIAERHTARALDLMERYPRLPARDALHVASMEDRGIERILSADRHFDQLGAITRVDPATFSPSL